MAKGTRDEAYYWISDRKEKTMNKQMHSLSCQTSESLAREFSPRQLQITDEPVRISESSGVGSFPLQAQQAQQAAEKEDVQEYTPGRIYVDPRERGMAKLLEARGMEVTLRNLDVGDYVVSDRVAIERKTASDFVDSIIDPERNLFRQIGDLSRSYDRPILILEGRDLYTRQVSPNSIRGALLTVAVEYGVPIIPTEDQDETASVIALLASREQKEGHDPKLHGHKTARTLKEQQEYLISAIPSVGPRVARNLLKHFGSIERIMTASQEELLEVEMVGPKIAERIREIVGGEYKG
jgi:Fanconi anemia group M protein